MKVMLMFYEDSETRNHKLNLVVQWIVLCFSTYEDTAFETREPATLPPTA